MKESFRGIPSPLQKQILLRIGLCIIGLTMFLLILIYGCNWQLILPCLTLVFICFSSAASLYDRCLQNNYVILTGTCTEIDRTPFRRRVRSIYLRSDRHDIKLIGIRKTTNLIIGDQIVLYLADSTAVYELDGCKVICSYLAMEKTANAKRIISTKAID